MQNNMDHVVDAGFFVRLAAYLIDSVIVGVALCVVVRFPIWILTLFSPNNFLVKDVIFDYSIRDIVVYALGVLYFILLTYKTGMTLGKKMLHIKVVSVEDRKMTLFEVIYRETIGRFLSGLILYAGYLLIGIQKEKRGLHDMMADTRVVYCHRKSVEVETPIEYQQVSQTYTVNSYIPLPQDETVEEETMEEETVENIEEELS